MKGVDSKKYDRCVKEVKEKQGKKVNAWAVCAASLKKNEKESKMKEEIKKAQTSESMPEATVLKTPEVQPSSTTVESAAVQQEVKLETAQAVETAAVQKEEVKTAPTIKLKGNLFNGFTLGSTLAQSPTGNVMTNMKTSPIDYQKVYKNSTKNQTMTSEQLKGSDKKGK